MRASRALRALRALLQVRKGVAPAFNTRHIRKEFGHVLQVGAPLPPLRCPMHAGRCCSCCCSCVGWPTPPPACLCPASHFFSCWLALPLQLVDEITEILHEAGPGEWVDIDNLMQVCVCLV